MDAQTPSQTVGPFFAYGLTPEQYGYDFPQFAGGNLRPAGDAAAGEPIRIVGQVRDGNGDLVPDAMLEIWQADGAGRYPSAQGGAGPNAPFEGIGRFGTGTEPDARFVFDTVKPGAVAEGHAPHINVTVFGRGLLNHLYTRIYFADEAQANDGDPLLALVPESCRATLLAVAEEGDASPRTYRFDIRLQGDGETVFFDL
jgi:protocatechuate 3,4-dioxygenase alpha subunit